MTTTTIYTVSGMTCGGCARSVHDAVARVEGVVDVDVRLDGGIVTVTSDTPIGRGRVKAAVDDAGYEVTS